MQFKIFALLMVAVAVIMYFVGYHFGIGNQTLKYGKTGFPKNCRAVITENLNGIALGKYSTEDALDSISRNCGSNGLIWDER